MRPWRMMVVNKGSHSATIHMLDVPFIHPHEANDQFLLGDIVGTCTLMELEVC
jgi:hypothetical protein